MIQQKVAAGAFNNLTPYGPINFDAVPRKDEYIYYPPNIYYKILAVLHPAWDQPWDVTLLVEMIGDWDTIIKNI
jgi:hypothetical protein